MEPRTALTVSLVTAGLAVAIVGLDSIWSLELTIESREDSRWEAVWTDPTQDRYLDVSRAFYDFCHGPTFRLVADNDKPLPDRVGVLVTYWNNETQREASLVDETISLGPFERQVVEWTVPENAGVPQARYPLGEKEPRPFVNVRIDGGYPDGYALDFCVREASA